MVGQREAPAHSELALDHTIRFFFEDPRWPPKLLIGGVFSFLSMFLLGIVWVSGYTVRIIRRVRRGDSSPLPEWNDLAGLFYDGIRPSAVLLAHLAAPLLLVVVLGIALGWVTAGSHQTPLTVAALERVLVLYVAGGFVLLTLVGLGLVVYLPAALLRCVVLDRLSAGFELRRNIRFIRRSFTSYKQVLAAFFLASFIAQFGLLALCIGLFPAVFWSTSVLGYALGVLARHNEEHLTQ